MTPTDPDPSEEDTRANLGHPTAAQPHQGCTEAVEHQRQVQTTVPSRGLVTA